MGYFNGANALMDLIPTSKLNDKNRSYFKANMQYYLNQRLGLKKHARGIAFLNDDVNSPPKPRLK